MFDVEFHQLSRDGKREVNEDSLGHASHEAGWIFALADGVGARNTGIIASRTAIRQVRERFRDAKVKEPLRVMLERLAHEVNLDVYEMAHNIGHGGASMATTLVACAFRDGRMALAHAGESRCYLVRDRRANLLTRHDIIPRLLGKDRSTEIDVADHAVRAGDVAVLCSDGLYRSVEGSEIAAVAGSGATLEHAAERLVTLANDRDGSDSMSVLLVRVRG